MPSRSQSVGSVMDLNSAERRIKDLIVSDETKATPKRKLESITSTEQLASAPKDDTQRKDKIVKDRTYADVSVQQEKPEQAATPKEDPTAQGAVCAAIIEDAKRELEKESEPQPTADKENVAADKPKSKIPGKVKVVKKKPAAKSKEPKPAEVEAPKPSIDRRNSRIFATAEKFQNIISGNEAKPAAEKPKKLITGVSVDGFKKEFERKASLTSATPPLEKGASEEKPEASEAPANEVTNGDGAKDESVPVVANGDRERDVRNAVNIISSALDKEGTRKSKSKPSMIGKPPVPFGASGRSSSGNIEKIPYPRFTRIGVADPPVRTRIISLCMCIQTCICIPKVIQ